MKGVKKHFYVSVHGDSILPNEGDAAYGFEIEATEEQVDELQRLFNGRQNADDQAFFRAHVPFLEYHHDQANDRYDDYLTDVYRMIHDLGTPETKSHIESMHILEHGTAAKEPPPEHL